MKDNINERANKRASEPTSEQTHKQRKEKKKQTGKQTKCLSWYNLALSSLDRPSASIQRYDTSTGYIKHCLGFVQPDDYLIRLYYNESLMLQVNIGSILIMVALKTLFRCSVTSLLVEKLVSILTQIHERWVHCLQ